MGKKQELRHVLLGRRRRLALEQRQERSRAIQALFVNHCLGVSQVSGCIALYAPICGEVRTQEAFDQLRKAGRRVAFPRCELTHRGLEFAAVNDLAELVPGAYGIPEPKGPAVPVEAIDVVAVPGLGFTRSGDRLGYGKGYYDRVLPRMTGQRVGLAFDFQLLDSLPSTPHDQRMDIVITEHGVIGMNPPH